MDKTYFKVLKYFNVSYDSDGCPHTTSYVTMDHIHDAMLKVGIRNAAQVGLYIVSAKRIAIDERRNRMRQYALLKEKMYHIDTEPFKEEILDYYNFNENEKIIIKERLAGIKMSNSRFYRKLYLKILEGIKLKISPTLYR